MKWKKLLCLLLIASVCFGIQVPSAKAAAANPLVRVLLTKLKLTDQVKIALDGSYTVNGISFQRGSQLTISCKSGTMMLYYEGMAMNVGTSVTLTRHAITTNQENGLRINGDYYLHPGSLVLSIKDNQLRAVLHAPVEEYLQGVVPYEMSDSFPLEALKAQAIAARTYALRKTGSSLDYDVVDNTNDQAYYGVKAEHVNAAQAIRDTAGICGFYKDQLAECYYSASNGGQTELVAHVWGSGDYGYLTMADDPYDVENPESVVKRYKIPKTISDISALGELGDLITGALSEALESRGYDGDTHNFKVLGIASAETCTPMYADSPSKIMTKLRLGVTVQARKLVTAFAVDEEEEISMFVVSPTPSPSTGKEEWSSLQTVAEPIMIELDLFPGLKTTLGLNINGGKNEIITVKEDASSFAVESRRYGHGVGMSQRGAQWMAAQYQFTCEQILRFYYPGMALKQVAVAYALPTPVADTFLATPGPAATPTPRPTLMPATSVLQANEYLVKVTGIEVTSTLNLRDQPGMGGAVIRQLYYGQELIVMEEVEDWLHVRTDAADGYVMSKFVSKVE